MATMKSLATFSGKVRKIAVTHEATQRLGSSFFEDLVDNENKHGFMVLISTRQGSVVRTAYPTELVRMSKTDPDLGQIVEIHKCPSNQDVLDMMVILKDLGYTKRGEMWKPPIGKSPFEIEDGIEEILYEELRNGLHIKDIAVKIRKYLK